MASIASEPPPHEARVRRLLAAADAPLVQLWGWPGVGKRAILRSLHRDGAACFLPEVRWRRPETLEPALALARAEGHEVFTAVGCGAGDLEAISGLLAPSERLVFANEEQVRGRGVMTLDPSSLLLTETEVAVRWCQGTGHELDPDEAAALRAASEGWLSVVDLWAAVKVEDGVPGPLDGAVAEVVGTFVRSRVLDQLTHTEQAALQELVAGGGSLPAGSDAGDDLRRLVECRALLLRNGPDLRLPRPLELALRRHPSDGAGASRAVHAWPARDARDAREPCIAIRLLGAPLVERIATDGAKPIAWPFERPLKLLAFLATRPGRRAPREDVVEAVWPDASEAAIRRNLHPTVSRLRSGLAGGPTRGGMVLLNRGVYQLDPSVDWQVDAEAFEDLVLAGERHAAAGADLDAVAVWREAWEMYRGSFLPAYEERWVEVCRERYQFRYLQLLRGLGEALLRLGSWMEAEDAARRLLLEDPLEEAVYGLLMRAYAGRGRRDLVNRQFERLRQVLVRELGVEPSAATLELYNELMA